MPATVSAVHPARPEVSSRRTTPVRISEIDGLRGVAMVLIAVYHIWFNRVSGGVDVFLMLSGFFITGSLLRGVERDGRIRFVAFYARIVRRIFPPALVVLVGVVVATLLFLPQIRWRDTLADVVAAAGYVVNWHLASNAVDYLASRNAASPVQHYWSLAIQAQFYLLWPVVIAATALLATRLAVRRRPTLAVVLVAILAASLAYSVHRTAADQVYTYFDTRARLWEFALGGLLLLALPYLRLPGVVRVALGWLGLVGLVTCGMVFTDGDEFPGWAALWPTLAAGLVIVAAGSGHRAGADGLLRSRPLTWVGDHSYALYLWHWPVLICYLAVSGNSRAGLVGGGLVIAASVALAVATRWLLEIRLPATGLGQRSNRGAFALAGGCVALVLLAATAAHGYVSWQQQRAADIDASAYPGAAYLAHGGDLPDVPFRPSLLEVKDDKPVLYDNGCHQSLRATEVITCEFGPAGADRTVALVGGSHSAHWHPALHALADRYGFRLVSITKSGCRFSVPGPEQQRTPCVEWNEAVLPVLAELRPDTVVTTATVVTREGEQTPGGYLAAWEAMAELGIPVVAIRDTPRPEFDVPECVARQGPGSSECGLPRAAYGLDRPAEVAHHPDLPSMVEIVDLTDYVCEPVRCPAVIGNVLVYHDGSHLTATFSRTLAPFLEPALIGAIRR